MELIATTTSSHKLVDTFGRRIDYLRMSVTDRCDFRCVYCMAEDMVFTPKSQLLTLEELAFIGETFIDLGVTKIRITGGEPLIRKDLPRLLRTIGTHKKLKNFAITTNGSRLDRFSDDLKKCGITRINISLDTLNTEKFSAITRTGKLEDVLRGIQVAKTVGFTKIKINSVIMRGNNDDEVEALVHFALENYLDISFIEEMPLGNISSHQRIETYISSEDLKARIEKSYRLIPSTKNTGGPSRYWQIPNSNTQVGFISPHSHNFCGDCNRVRLTAEGRLLLCLGNEHSVDLRAVVRQDPFNKNVLSETIQQSLTLKPERHHFKLTDEPDIVRFMNATGG